MHRPLQNPPTHKRQLVPNIDDQRPIPVLHIPPLVIRHQHLQRGHRLRDEGRQRVEVRVPVEHHAVRLPLLLRRERVVDHVAQEVVAAPAVVGLVELPEVALGELEDAVDEVADAAEDFLAGFLRRWSAGDLLKYVKNDVQPRTPSSHRRTAG